MTLSLTNCHCLSTNWILVKKSVTLWKDDGIVCYLCQDITNSNGCNVFLWKMENVKKY